VNPLQRSYLNANNELYIQNVNLPEKITMKSLPPLWGIEHAPCTLLGEHADYYTMGASSS